MHIAQPSCLDRSCHITTPSPLSLSPTIYPDRPPHFLYPARWFLSDRPPHFLYPARWFLSDRPPHSSRSPTFRCSLFRHHTMADHDQLPQQDATATSPAATPPPSSTKTKSLMTSLSNAVSSTLQTHNRTLSFKEDTYIPTGLTTSEQKSLRDLKHLLATSSPSLTLWGIPLLPTPPDDRSDVVLLKFLRARDFHAPQAHAMLLRCAEWRKEFGADGLLSEELGLKELEGVVAYMHGCDREGHPVCYNAYGVFKDKEVYDRVLGDDDKLKRFLRWRVQVMERGVGLLQFKPGGVNSIIQVTDLKDMPKRELKAASGHILSLFQDNYPEMVARKVFVNVPWYFSTLYSMISPFLTQRTKSKFVIAKEANVAETLYKFIRPEFVPVQYGGLGRPGDLQNGPPKPASEFTVKGGEKVNLEIDGIEGGATITWDVVVGGWDVDYGAEYVPADDTSYTVVVERTRRVPPGEEPVHNAYTSREPGKMVISVDNTTSRRRKVAAYRYFVRKPSSAQLTMAATIPSPAHGPPASLI